MVQVNLHIVLQKWRNFIMSDNKIILSLYYGEGLSQRKIAEITGISRNTISPVCRRADELKLDFNKIQPMSYEEIDHLLFPDRRFIPAYEVPDFDYVHKELLKPGTTLMMLYEEYVESCKKEKLPYYKKTQFYDLYSDHVSKNRLTMHISHKPADRVQVDWFGTTMEVYDRYSGEVYTAYLFCGTLPFSMLSFIYACPDMKISSWIDCHIRMFEYFDGVPRLLVPDNLKTGVKSNKKYEDPVLNKAYQEMADHYGITIIPARVKAPKDYLQKKIIFNFYRIIFNHQYFSFSF